MPASSTAKNQASKVVRRLKRDYADAWCALEFETPFQLLVATILSAQCTDERVNQVTRQLFKKYHSVEQLSQVPLRTLEREIQPTGFFRNKAKSIKGCCEALLQDHGGDVPREIDALIALPGVGRKTANVVLGTAFGLPSGVVVDTHVGRISRRLGLTSETDPVKIELDLMAILAKKEWVMYSHRVIHHGRQVCKARKPMCDSCGMQDICPRVGV